MAATTLAILEQALKTQYLDVMTSFINENSGPFMAMIEKGNHDMADLDTFTWFMKYGSSAGIKNMAEDGVFGTPGGRKFKKASLSVVNMGAPFAITDKSIKVTKNKKRSMVNALTDQMDDLSKDYRFQLRRQLFGSTTGVLTTTKANASKTAISLADDANMNKFRRGMVIDILDANDSDAKLGDSREITGIDRDGKIITISGAAITTEAGDKVTIEDSLDLEMTGLEDIMTKDNTIYGLDRSDDTYSFLNPFITALDASSNIDINLEDFDSMIDDIDELYGDVVNYMHGQKGPVGNYVKALRRYQVNVETQKFEAGRKVIEYNGVKIAKEGLAKPNIIEFLSTEHFKLAHVGDKMYDWMEQDKAGGILKMSSERKPIYEAFLIGYMNLLCFKPSSQGRITNVRNY